jgi:hypothetical protein
MEYTQHIAIEGQRWDTVAEIRYGRSDLAKIIIAANPNIPITPRLEAGTVLQIPILEKNDPETDPSLLPHWKR